ncbi:MAG: O-antigen/teichoic acid export membrane protein [Mariniflexile sp.]|jgi:O-antigen/teichoic acid export membrane protein
MKSNFINQIIPQSKFFKSVAVLAGGTASAQLISVLAAPILTRLYTPEDFGMLAVFVSIVAIFTVIASLRYELAIPLPLKDQDAANITVLSLGILIITSTLSFVIVFCFSNEIANALNAQNLIDYLWMLPVSVFMIGAYQIFNYWAIRKNTYKLISNTKIKQAVATVCIQLIGSKFGQIFLLGGQIAGQSIGTFALSKSAFSNSEFRQVNITEIKRLAIRYKKFPMYSTVSGFLNTAGNQLPPLILAAYFDMIAAGLFMLANKMLMLPVSMVGSAISNVFLAEAPNANRNNELAVLVRTLFLKLIDISLVPAIILILLGQDLFAVIFGPEWAEAGIMASWMAVWLFFVFISSPLSTIFTVLEKQKQSLLFNSVLLIVRALAITFGSMTGDLVFTIAVFSISSAICWLMFCCWVIAISGNKFGDLYLPIFKTVIFSILCVSPLVLSMQFNSASLMWFIGLPITLIILFTSYFKLLKNG